MTRVAVIGNAGGGKSTLCRKPGAALDLPVFEIDQIQWRPGWVPTPADEFERQHAQIARRERWLIDGWGSAEAIRALRGRRHDHSRRSRAVGTLLVGDQTPD